MKRILSGLSLSAFSFILLLLACGEGGDTLPVPPPPDNPAIITFSNESSFMVKIYKNYVDPERLVCTINSGQSPVSTLHYARFDQDVSDVFYLRFMVPFVDMLDTKAGKTIYIDAVNRTLLNITHAVKPGERCLYEIKQPPPGELSVVNGYMVVQNLGTAQVSINRAAQVLKNMDDIGDVTVLDHPQFSGHLILSQVLIY